MYNIHISVANANHLFSPQVSSAPPPPIPKHPLPALEAPPDVPMLVYSSPLSSAPFPSSPSSPSQSFATESPQVEEEEEWRGKEQEGNGKVLDGQPGVFMTQVCNMVDLQ